MNLKNNYTINVEIKGCGFYVPERIMTNSDLEEIIDTTDEWIQSRTGIIERRIASNEQASSDLATIACKRALFNAGISSEKVDMIIVATITPDMMFPSTACIVQNNIGAHQSVAFDIEAACSGFIFALSVAEQYIKNNVYKTVVVIGSEIFSRIVNWEDRNTCTLFGDGAGAVVLQNTKEDNGLKYTHLGSDGNGSSYLYLPAGGSRIPASQYTINNKLHFLQMKGKEIYRCATKFMTESVMTGLINLGLTVKDIDLFIPHQANKRIIESVAGNLKLPREKIFINVNKYGNTSAASIPIALCEALEQGRIKKGDIVVLVAFGSGFTWGISILKW